MQKSFANIDKYNQKDIDWCQDGVQKDVDKDFQNGQIIQKDIDIQNEQKKQDQEKMLM